MAGLIIDAIDAPLPLSGTDDSGAVGDPSELLLSVGNARLRIRACVDAERYDVGESEKAAGAT